MSGCFGAVRQGLRQLLALAKVRGGLAKADGHTKIVFDWPARVAHRIPPKVGPGLPKENLRYLRCGGDPEPAMVVKSGQDLSESAKKKLTR